MTKTGQRFANKKVRVLVTAVVVWALLQIPRLVAIPLISDVLAGTESPAWLWPAILDSVLAVSAVFVAYLLWYKKGLGPWVTAIVFFVVSIVDHGAAISAEYLTATPQILQGTGGVAGLLLGVGLDAAAIWILATKTVRTHYLGDSPQTGTTETDKAAADSRQPR
jgi:hypothetical protein